MADTTRFEMIEVFSGLALPWRHRGLPDFKPIFERYAVDLKAEAESSAAARHDERAITSVAPECRSRQRRLEIAGRWRAR